MVTFELKTVSTILRRKLSFKSVCFLESTEIQFQTPSLKVHLNFTILILLMLQFLLQLFMSRQSLIVLLLARMLQSIRSK